MENLRDHTIAWLDSTGADGLMTIPNKHGSMLFFEKHEINLAFEIEKASELVPAFRHADGSYHTDKEYKDPCISCWRACTEDKQANCVFKHAWLVRKEATK